MSEWVLGADHEAQAVLVNVVHLQIGGLDRQSDDANIHGAVLDALKDFVAEVPIDTDVHQGIAALKLRKTIGEQVEAAVFNRAESGRGTGYGSAVRHRLD